MFSTMSRLFYCPPSLFLKSPHQVQTVMGRTQPFLRKISTRSRLLWDAPSLFFKRSPQVHTVMGRTQPFLRKISTRFRLLWDPPSLFFERSLPGSDCYGTHPAFSSKDLHQAQSVLRLIQPFLQETLGLYSRGKATWMWR
jgi:hypothetical protein